MRTSWKVGLATCALEPVPWATPRTKVVLPAPSSPVRRTTSPVLSCSPSSMPKRSVSAGELVTCSGGAPCARPASGKVVVAGGLELGADDDDLRLRGHAADDGESRATHDLFRSGADELRL